jgi:23S rRNA pseudouridine1911/1915/1917 synthase
MAQTYEAEDEVEVLHLTIGPDAPDRLDKALAALVPEAASLSRTRIMRMIAEGAVLKGDIPVRDGKAKVAEGEVYTLRLDPPEPVDVRPEDIPLEVVWEDADLIVINKPVGMVVHPAPGTPNGTLVNALLHHFGDTLSGIGGVKRPGIVHRIDKDTSGLLVVAKSDRAHHGLAAQFEDHSVTRRYLAVLYGTPEASDPRIRGLRGVSFEAGGILRIATHLARHKTDRQRQAVVWDQGRHAVTRVRVVERFGGGAASLVECWLETGRTHQIRVHLASKGSPCLGDPVYGSSPAPAPVRAAMEQAGLKRQALHASVLGFVHPITAQTLRFETPMPADMQTLQTLLSKLGEG